MKLNGCGTMPTVLPGSMLLLVGKSNLETAQETHRPGARKRRQAI
jgi:hypothetical protein